ncbi:MAG: ATP-dependent zinc metalloprotease FtsH [Gemmatimonadetes bacterium]|nr:ATP-dependent zinc metalloprotease FtsH [Gemmatimonadota bacterium]MBT8405340.1 ATP-dependent zinc metalloprotease FtsH [Gemmatimonadota bacterium]
MSKTLALWVIIIVMSIFALRFVQGQDETRVELAYTEFRDQLENGNVDEVTFIQLDLEGELRAPITREGRQYTTFTSILPNGSQESLLEQLETQDVVVRAEKPQTGWGTLLIGALPWLLFLAFWIWIFRTMQGGGNRAFQFSRSKAKMISPEAPKITFADVAGADEAKEELQEIIEFLKDPQKFARLGGRLPKGVLLVGPPGTGKTLLAKAVAGEAGRPFFQMSGSDFVEMFVGVGASRVRDLFEQGKAHAPCIIFIDEIDAVGRHRGAGLGGGHDEREQTLNALLVEMDGFESNEGVILLAATNRPDVLDPALLRPGRFDRQVVVDAPDVKGREAILRVHAKKLPLADDVELGILARGTPGLSGADLANICNEAALLAARRNGDKVAQADFEKAKDKVMLGAERKSLVLTEHERKLTAWHEAGHAVIGLRVPGLDPVHKVTIVPRGRALGITASLPKEDRHSYTKDWLQGQLVMLFGGRVAEEMIFGPDKVTTGAGNDIERATAMARRMVTSFGMSEVIGLMAIGDSEQEVFLGREIGHRRQVSEHTAQRVDQEVKRILDESHDRARVVLEEHDDLLERIALALLERETLGAAEIALLDEGRALPPLEVPGEALQPGKDEGAWARLKGREEAGASVRPSGLADEPGPPAPAEG